MTSTESVTIIAAIALAGVQLITAWRTSAKVTVLQENTNRHDARADDKLDKIHELTNSNLTSVKTDLALANDRIIKLETLLKTVVAGSGETIKKAKVEVEKSKKKVADSLRQKP